MGGTGRSFLGATLLLARRRQVWQPEREDLRAAEAEAVA